MSFEFYNDSKPLGYTEEVSYRNGIAGQIADIILDIGDISTLNTDVKTSLVAALNLVNSYTGNLSNLTTTAKDNIVNSLNELKANITDIVAGSVTDGSITDLKLDPNGIRTTVANILTNIGTLAELPTTDKTNLVNSLKEIDTNINIINTELAERATYKKAQGLISDYNTTTKIGTDNTTILNSLITTLENLIIADGYGKHDNVIAIPPGYYYFSDTINISNIVQLKPMGQVFFVFGGGGKKFLNIESKQLNFMWLDPWQTGSIIDGSNGGLVLMTNSTERITGSVALSIGNTASGKDMVSRYRLAHITIGTYFDIGLQLEGYDHYIGSFEYLHIAQCNTLINFKSAVLNSGEKFTFRKCVFDGAQTSVMLFDNAMDVSFNECHFDYNKNIILWTSTSLGWQSIQFDHCYFERIYDYFAIGNGTSGAGYMKPQITFNKCISYVARKNLFGQSNKGYIVRIDGWEFRLALEEQSQRGVDSFLVNPAATDVEIYYRDIQFSHKAGYFLPDKTLAPSLNFSSLSAGLQLSTGGISGITFISSSGSFDAAASVTTTAESATGTSSLKLMNLVGSDNDTASVTFRCDDKIRVNYKDRVVIATLHKVKNDGPVLGINKSIVIEQYDSSDVLLSSITLYGNNNVTSWSANNRTIVGTVRKPTVSNDHLYMCSAITNSTLFNKEGYTGTTEPTWPTSVDGTVVDGDVTWTEMSNKWYTSYSFSDGSSVAQDYVITNPKCTYVKLKITYSAFREMYVDQIAVNVLKQ